MQPYKRRVRARSLNFHDFAVVYDMIPVADGRIPMSDGAGEGVAVGDGVKTFKVGDHALSTFFPNWPGGGPTLERLAGVPGDPGTMRTDSVPSWSGEVMTALQMSKSVTVRGITVGSREDQQNMIAAIEASSIRPVIDSRFPLDDIAGAFAHQRSQKHLGKICLEI